jgi:hypothetical protein
LADEVEKEEEKRANHLGNWKWSDCKPEQKK